MRKPKKNEIICVTRRMDMCWNKIDDAAATYTWDGTQWTRTDMVVVDVNYNSAKAVIENIRAACEKFFGGPENCDVEIDTYEQPWGGASTTFKVNGTRAATDMEIIRINIARGDRIRVMAEAQAAKDAMEAEEVQAFIKAHPEFDVRPKA